MRHLFPNFPRVAVDSSISYFLLMFGYKLFSAYFSLYLLELGFSVAKVGYTYLLIYLPIAISAPFVGYLLYRVRPVFLSSLGILGYGLYAVGLLFLPDLFNPLQMLLGISAALFLVSTRVIMIRAKLDNYDSAFGLFYSAPVYAELIAPLIGGALLLYFDFAGVFAASFAVHLINMFFNLHRFGENGRGDIHPPGSRHILQNYRDMFKGIVSAGILPQLILGFIILIVDGFYSAFFLIFLRTFLNFSQNEVIFYVSALSLFFVPISIFAVNMLHRHREKVNMFQGSAIYALATIVFSFVSAGVSLFGVLAVNLMKGFGGLIANSGRSGVVSRTFPGEPEEAGVLDTVFAPLGVSLGAFLGGIIAYNFGFSSLFLAGGTIVLVGAVSVKLFFLKKVVKN